MSNDTNIDAGGSNAIMDQISLNWSNFWMARSQQERKLLTLCALVVLLALVYLVLLGPAISGRARLEKNLPDLRQQVTVIQALAQEAQALAGRAPLSAPPMTKDSLMASLTQRGLTANVNLTSDFAKVQLTTASFATVLAWLDEMQKANQITVLDASFVAQPVDGMVNATLTLKQQKGDQ